MQRINEDIKTGNFKQIYLLYGEERYLKNQYTTRLRKALCQDGDEMNTHFYQGKDFSLGQVIDLAETLPFLAERRVMFFKDTGLFKAGGEKLAEYLANPNDTTFFVFTESEVDKRSKLYKAAGLPVSWAGKGKKSPRTPHSSFSPRPARIWKISRWSWRS